MSWGHKVCYNHFQQWFAADPYTVWVHDCHLWLYYTVFANKYWIDATQTRHLTNEEKNAIPSNAYLTSHKVNHDMETLHLEVTQLCALRPMQHQRNSGGNNVELTSQAVVVAHAGRRQEKTHTGTHCGMHAQFFNKKGTNGQACTTSRICTHIIIIAAAASVN